MFCKNKKQKIFNKEILELYNQIKDNNENIDIQVDIFQNNELDRISFHSIFVSSTFSNKIEGIEINETNSKEINELNSKFIENYQNALSYVFNNYDNLKLTEKEILTNHRILFSGTNFPFAGKYKLQDNSIVNLKTRTLINKTAKWNETPSLMNELIYWYETENQIPDIIKDCIFIYDFLKIHPFEDGNGRVSRLLMNLLFLKNGCGFLKYVSLEEHINKNVENYYQTLKSDYLEQWFQNETDYTRWIEFCFEVLINAQEKFLNTIREKEILSEVKNKKLVIALWFELHSNKKFTRTDIINAMLNYDVSIDTIKKTIPELIKKGYITKYGATNKAIYGRGISNQEKIAYEDIEKELKNKNIKLRY